GLGAILCAILIGQAPFEAETAPESLDRALRADLTATLAALEGCGAEPEMVQLARDCLAAEPAGRPPDGGAVAAGVAACRAGVQQRLRAAELERAAAEARAEEAQARVAAERHARRLTLGLAGAVLLVVALAGAAVAWWRQNQLQRGAEQ